MTDLTLYILAGVFILYLLIGAIVFNSIFYPIWFIKDIINYLKKKGAK